MLCRVVLLLSISLVQSTTGTCKNRAECAYNGHCVDGICRCYSQYTGQHCDRYNFLKYNGEGLRTLREDGQQISSWGGSVLLSEDGKYHMWAAEMTNETGIKAWITNSQVVHAVAEPPEFRFVRQAVIWPVFSHEPTVARAPTGEFVMFFTTNFGEKPGSQCNPPCGCGHNGTSCLSCPNDQQCAASPRAPMSTRMSFAHAAEAPTPTAHPFYSRLRAMRQGPWSTPVLVPAPTTGDTNLACVIHANASLTCMGRPGLGMLFAPHWRHVEGYHWQVPRGDIKGEDPMLYLDPHDPEACAQPPACLPAPDHRLSRHCLGREGAALRDPRRGVGRPVWLPLLEHRRRPLLDGDRQQGRTP